MKKRVSIVVAGIGGMGSVYFASLSTPKSSPLFNLEGAVDPHPQKSPCLAALRSLNVPVFRSLEDFYSRHRADLAIISSPIQYHSAQTCLALSQGGCVLCEKPAAATVQEVRQMIEASQKTGKWVAVGYQWSFSKAIQDLKRDIQNGMLGKPRRLRCLYLWPRDEAYYRRNSWAGRKKDGRGLWALDSPANNAMAHDLHNMFYVLGKTTSSSAEPGQVEAELYRAYDIPNFDTAAIRCLTRENVEILFYVSHAADADTGPVFSYEFEKGIVSLSGRNSDIRARLSDGGAKNYGSPDSEPLQKLWTAIDLAGGTGLPHCGLEAAISQTLCLNGAQDSMPRIKSFPRSLLVESGDPGKRSIFVKGLAEALKECYDKAVLPSELGVSWSRKGRVIDLVSYGNFPGGGH